jgi:hypothetical protein
MEVNRHFFFFLSEHRLPDVDFAAKHTFLPATEFAVSIEAESLAAKSLVLYFFFFHAMGIHHQLWNQSFFFFTLFFVSTILSILTV